MTTTVKFHPGATIEQRKTAINEAMQTYMPFELKQILLDIPGLTATEYTGGMTQMLLARAATIKFKKLC